MKFRFRVKDSMFKKSSFTQRGGLITCCAAVAITPKGVAIRNSNDETKNTIFFTPGEWVAFIKGVKNNEFEI
ncbi:MAG: DUF397 domain-containing protein [Patescibacteria group bacterium]